jgi:two-component system cell cycle response regulator
VSTEGRFLVIDDSSVNRLILTAGLEEHGHTVLVAENGRQGLQILREQPVDVVLLDIEMPDMNGYEVLAEIKADASLRDLPVIVISAIGGTASVIRCIEMGAIDYLPKPFDPTLLEARINASLAARRLRALERHVLEHVDVVVDAGAALAAGSFTPDSLEVLARRDDALGSLARGFQSMAAEIQAREERLRREVDELRSEIRRARPGPA